jgi:hypothetical protein
MRDWWRWLGMVSGVLLVAVLIVATGCESAGQPNTTVPGPCVIVSDATYRGLQNQMNTRWAQGCRLLGFSDRCADADVPTNGLLGRAAPRWEQWMTPRVSNNPMLGYVDAKKLSRIEDQVAVWLESSHQDRPTSTAGETGSKGVVLNPLFVETLQGFPIGWTDCAPSVTPSSLSKPPTPSACCGNG